MVEPDTSGKQSRRQASNKMLELNYNKKGQVQNDYNNFGKKN